MIDIKVSGLDTVTLVAVKGRVDSMNANQLGDALTGEIDGGHTQIVLDLAGVDYMSSAGLREMVAALKRVKRMNGEGDVRLAQPSERVREVLEMAGLDTIFRIFDSPDGAISSY